MGVGEERLVPGSMDPSHPASRAPQFTLSAQRRGRREPLPACAQQGSQEAASLVVAVVPGEAGLHSGRRPWEPFHRGCHAGAGCGPRSQRAWGDPAVGASRVGRRPAVGAACAIEARGPGRRAKRSKLP